MSGIIVGVCVSMLILLHAAARAVHRSTSRKKCVTLHAVQCRGVTSVGPFHFLLNLFRRTFFLGRDKILFTLFKLMLVFLIVISEICLSVSGYWTWLKDDKCLLAAMIPNSIIISIVLSSISICCLRWLDKSCTHSVFWLLTSWEFCHIESQPKRCSSQSMYLGLSLELWLLTAIIAMDTWDTRKNSKYSYSFWTRNKTLFVG